MVKLQTAPLAAHINLPLNLHRFSLPAFLWCHATNDRRTFLLSLLSRRVQKIKKTRASKIKHSQQV